MSTNWPCFQLEKLYSEKKSHWTDCVAKKKSGKSSIALESWISSVDFYLFLKDGSQRGVILSTGQEWEEQRKFTIRHLRSLGFARTSMESAILLEVQSLCEILEENSATSVQPIGVHM